MTGLQLEGIMVWGSENKIVSGGKKIINLANEILNKRWENEIA